jgi:hypothetical protein
MSLHIPILIAVLGLSMPWWVHAGEARRPANHLPRLVGSWQCSTRDPSGQTLDSFLAFTFSLGHTAKSSFVNAVQGQGSWEQTGPRTFRSLQHVIAGSSLTANLDADLTLPPSGPLQLQARVVVNGDPDAGQGPQQLDLVGTCTRIEPDPQPPAISGGRERPGAGASTDSVVGSWLCRDSTMSQSTFGLTFELGQTFLATPTSITGHGAWRRTGRSTFSSRDTLALTPFALAVFVFDSVYELDRTGSLAVERVAFFVDPTTGERMLLNVMSGSCQRIEVRTR